MKLKAEFTFPKELKDKATICTICKQFDIVLNIIEASFSTETGWAILVFEGSETEINKTFDFLKSHSVEIKNQEALS